MGDYPANSELIVVATALCRRAVFNNVKDASTERGGYSANVRGTLPTFAKLRRGKPSEAATELSRQPNIHPNGER